MEERVMASQLKQGLAIPKFVIPHLHHLHLLLHLHLLHHAHLVKGVGNGLLHVTHGLKNLVHLHLLLHLHLNLHLLHHPNLVKNGAGDSKSNGVANRF